MVYNFRSGYSGGRKVKIVYVYAPLFGGGGEVGMGGGVQIFCSLKKK